MKSRRVRIVLFLLPVLLCVACPARWHFVFINATDRALEVAFDETGKPSVVSSGARKSVLYPLGRTQQEFYTRRVIVSGPDGARLYDASATNLFWRLKGDAVQYPNVYILLTTNAAYTVPRNFRDTWKEHMDEIKAIQ